MPPKRKAESGAKTAGGGGGGRQSRLAKEHNITAQEEAEIKEAFELFAEPIDGEKEDVIPIEDVRRAMIALDIPPKDRSELDEFKAILDPSDDGYATYPFFVAICALKLRARDGGGRGSAGEVDEAFALFAGAEGKAITVAHLRRVAAILKEEVDEDLLRDMILEANGGAGVGRGVRKGDFENVMRRAGVWR